MQGVESRHRFVRTSVNVHILEWDGGDRLAPPVVLIHGFSSNAHVWEPVAAALAGRGYYVVAPELRAHGQSSGAGERLDLRTLADDVYSTVLAQLARPAVIVGHSLGGTVALEIAASHPEAVHGLVLAAGFIDPGSDQEGAFRALLPGPWKEPQEFWRKTFRDYWSDSEPPAGWLERYSENSLEDVGNGEWQPRPSRPDYEKIARSLSQHQPAELLRQYPGPVVALIGDADETPVANWQADSAIRRANADVDIVHLHGAGHWIPLGNASEVVTAVVKVSARAVP